MSDVNTIKNTINPDSALGIIQHMMTEIKVSAEDILTLYKGIYDCEFGEDVEKVLLKMLDDDEKVTLEDAEHILVLMESLRKPKKDKETLTLPTEPHSPWTVPYPTYPNTPTWPSYPITSGEYKPLDIRYCCNRAKSPYSVENTSVAGSYDKS